MLILTRRTNETVHIGSEVTVTVLGVIGNSVRLGITAPRSTEVHRSEVYERIQQERRSQSPAGDVDGNVAQGATPTDEEIEIIVEVPIVHAPRKKSRAINTRKPRPEAGDA